MSDISALALNQSLIQSALLAAPQSNSSLQSLNNSANSANEQGVYAVKGDSLYKEEMDINTDGVITNAELSQYYAQIAGDYGDNVDSLQDKSVGNVVTTAQAANTYAANEAAYSAPYTSLIETSA